MIIYIYYTIVQSKEAWGCNFRATGSQKYQSLLSQPPLSQSPLSQPPLAQSPPWQSPLSQPLLSQSPTIKEISQQRDLTAKRSHSREVSQQRDPTAKRSHRREVSQQRSLRAKRSHGFNFQFLTIWRKSRTKALFSHLPFSLFEGRLARNAFLEVSGWHRNAVFCRTKCASEDGWGSLSGRRLRNTLVWTGIMVGSAAQWNWQFRRRFAYALARRSFVFCNSVSADRIVINGCVKVAWCRGCVRNICVFCSWTS